MDDRTAQLLEALDPVGASLLLEMLRGPCTEADLLKAVGDPAQPTGNRRLHRLKAARLVAQEAGKERAPGRLWSVIHPNEIEAVLTALLALSEVVDTHDRARRAEAKRTLEGARAERLGLRQADDDRAPRRSSPSSDP